MQIDIHDMQDEIKICVDIIKIFNHQKVPYPFHGRETSSMRVKTDNPHTIGVWGILEVVSVQPLHVCHSTQNIMHRCIVRI